MTRSEEIVGRRLPAPAKHLDELMASFVKADGSFHGKMSPGEVWLRKPHHRARRNGWIERRSSVCFGKGPATGVWYLTEAGEKAALEAKARVDAINAARIAWARDFGEKMKGEKV